MYKSGVAASEVIVSVTVAAAVSKPMRKVVSEAVNLKQWAWQCAKP